MSDTFAPPLPPAPPATAPIAPLSYVPPPITFEELSGIQHARLASTFEAQGFYFAPEDLPALNAAHAAHPDYLAELTVADPELRRRTRRTVVQDAMRTIAGPLIAAGVRRERPGASGPVLQGTPEPSVWPNGAIFQQVTATALHELDGLVDVMTLAGDAALQVREATGGLGLLFTEDEVSEMLRVSTAQLRTWRSRRVYFEFIKFPGQRGSIRYTERGIRAFCADTLQSPTTMPESTP